MRASIPSPTLLQAETATAVVGADAQAALMEACAADGRSYGFARNSWGPETSVVAATPSGDRIDTHLFVGVDLPDDLLWELDDALVTTGPECTLRQNSSEHSERFTEDTQPVSISRIRGVNDVGGFDRWDRVRAMRHADGASVPSSPPTPSKNSSVTPQMDASGGESRGCSTMTCGTTNTPRRAVWYPRW
ncbi:hypothetical protein JCM17092_26090 [Haloplanus litoreus]